MFRAPLVRQLGFVYNFEGSVTSDDPRDSFFSPEESRARMLAIIEQHPDTGIADVYRQELSAYTGPAGGIIR